jgi:hypothetical protein
MSLSGSIRAKTTNVQELIYHKIKAIEAGFLSIFMPKSLKFIDAIVSILDMLQVASKANHAGNHSLIVHFK